jgi:hypothetical protein
VATVMTFRPSPEPRQKNKRSDSISQNLVGVQAGNRQIRLPVPIEIRRDNKIGPLGGSVETDVPKVPSPFPSRMEKVPEAGLITARSRLPSPLKSATAIEEGPVPTA